MKKQKFKSLDGLCSPAASNEKGPPRCVLVGMDGSENAEDAFNCEYCVATTDCHRDTNNYTSQGFNCEYCVATIVTETQLIIQVKVLIVSIVWLRLSQRHK